MKHLVFVALLFVVSTNRAFAQQPLSVVVPRWGQDAQHDSRGPRTWSDSGYSKRATWVGAATGAVTGAIAGGFAGDYVARGLCDLPRDRCGGTRREVVAGAAVAALAGGALGYLIGVMIDEERNSQSRTSDGRGHRTDVRGQNHFSGLLRGLEIVPR